ncbi:MAG: phenylalanine--tRNA ligase subunit beta, partial [Chloroflexota bacterium]|nr:phenylalanine--tRNA ligase subunit beta [Chloroflexota bacterium]
RNPIRADERLMRPTLIPSLVTATAANLKHSRSVRFFEIAPVYLSREDAVLPDEPSTLAVVVAGEREPFGRFTPTAASGAGGLDFFDLKGIVDSTLVRAGAGAATWEPTSHPALHPGRSATIGVDGKVVGIAGELRPEVAAAAGIDDVRVGVAEIDLTGLYQLVAATPPIAISVPRFLPVEQDFAVVVDAARPAAEVEGALRDGAGSLVTGVTLFDVYSGPQVGAGKKSLAYRVTFTAPDRALTDSELRKVRKRIERTLAQRVGGTLRA